MNFTNNCGEEEGGLGVYLQESLPLYSTALFTVVDCVGESELHVVYTAFFKNNVEDCLLEQEFNNNTRIYYYYYFERLF